MAENDAPAAAGTTEQPPQIKMNILAQYIRDLSFENILAQKGIQGEVSPDISVQVNLDAKKRTQPNQYEVITKIQVDSTVKGGDDKLFLLELEYAGVFNIENVPDEQMHPFLLIECPRMTFPFVRRVVSDVTRDGGFPPLTSANQLQIDFRQNFTIEQSAVQRAV